MAATAPSMWCGRGSQKPGQYSYINDMTLRNAGGCALAGGFTPQAKSTVYVRHEGETHGDRRSPARTPLLIRPGDTVRVDTTLFWDAMNFLRSAQQSDRRAVTVRWNTRCDFCDDSPFPPTIAPRAGVRVLTGRISMKRILVSALLLGAPDCRTGCWRSRRLLRPPGRAGGRGPAAPPPSEGPAGPEAAIAIPPEKNIPLAQALDAVQTAIDTCLKAQRTSAAVAMVVDLNGNIRVQLSADNTGLPFYDFARRKAYTC